MASDHLDSSSSTLPSSSSSPAEKFACVCVWDNEEEGLQWYAFDVSDDAEHNQHPPPPLPPPYCYHYRDPTHFHLDDECGAVNLNPRATRSMKSCLGYEWAILGSSETTTRKTFLYHIAESWWAKRGRDRVHNYGIRLERIDLISSSSPNFSPTPDLKKAKWEHVPTPPMLLDRVRDVRTVVLQGKLYFLGRLEETGEEEQRSKKKMEAEEEEEEDEEGGERGGEA